MVGGWWSKARRVDSPNFDARPADAVVDLLVLHNISLPPEQFGGGEIERFLTNRLDAWAHPYFAGIADIRVSSHFVIDRRGEVLQFVSCEDCAWHAGQSDFLGRARCNDFSIGVELEGSDTQPFTDAQYAQLAHLSWALLAHYPIAAVAGHTDIAPQRKTDPGPHFDWARYASQTGLAHDFFPYGLAAR
ncbi:MAG: 1,6-anhydro-N-acetylmuramyl-L-alanine amidase AmpD [Candidatus Protistobacter heckmanni]|nr:1,6-anhydro-N-acetylmuramyl-L-alanine amidase AmpD [Candidatus Protistobacter heckmanni]